MCYCVRRIFACVLLGALSGVIASSQTIHSRGGFTLPPPPDAEAVPVTDDYFGTKIQDNYRWLENASSPETKTFIDAENAYTQRYMEQARIRPQISDDMDALEHVSSWTVPIERGNDLFFEKMLAGEEQSSIYVRHGWAEKDKRLIDPAQFSRDPNTSVNLDDVSRDGTLVAYDVRQGGADESTVRVFNVKTGKTLDDELPSGIYLSVAFTPDGKGLYYSRMDQKGTLIYEHELGARISHDMLVFGKEFRGEELGPSDLMEVFLSDDYRYLVVQIDRGVPPKRVDIVYRDLTKPGSYFEVLIWGVDSRFSADYVKGAWYVSTDYKSPNWRIMKADPGIMPDAWTTIVPEGPDAIEGFNIVGDKIYVNRLHDVKTETDVYTLDGKPAGRVEHEGIGMVTTLAGRADDRYGFYSFESFIAPPTIYRLDTVTGKQEIFAQPKVPFDSSQYELKQVFYTSKDGTRVPMFIAGKKGLKQDGTERLLMTAYGGFNLSMLPRVETDVRMVDRGGRLVCASEFARRGRIRRALARAGDVREKAECIRRFLRRGRVPDRQQIHFSGTFRHLWRIEWRAADGRGDYREAGSVFGCGLRVSAAGYAALPEVRARSALDDGVWIGG